MKTAESTGIFCLVFVVVVVVAFSIREEHQMSQCDRNLLKKKAVQQQHPQLYGREKQEAILPIKPELEVLRITIFFNIQIQNAFTIKMDK